VTPTPTPTITNTPTPTPTITNTPTPTPTITSFAYFFTYDNTSCDTACLNNDPITVYSADSPLGIGSQLYYSSSLTSEVINGYYSDGTTCYSYAFDNTSEINNIQAISSCATPTPTPTPPPVECWQCSIDFTIYNDQTECSNSCIGGSCNQVICP